MKTRIWLGFVLVVAAIFMAGCKEMSGIVA